MSFTLQGEPSGPSLHVFSPNEKIENENWERRSNLFFLQCCQICGGQPGWADGQDRLRAGGTPQVDLLLRTCFLLMIENSFRFPSFLSWWNLKLQLSNGFALVRPPGHHAEAEEVGNLHLAGKVQKFLHHHHQHHHQHHHHDEYHQHHIKGDGLLLLQQRCDRCKTAAEKTRHEKGQSSLSSAPS